MWFLFVSACIFLPGQAPIEGQNAGECSDAADNDGDGAFDCDDPDCANSPDCASDNANGSTSDTDEWAIEPVPSDIGDLSLFLFEHVDNPDPVPLRLGATELQEWLDGLDWQPDPLDDAIELPILDGTALGTLALPPGTVAADQITVGLPWQSPASVGVLAQPITTSNQICVMDDEVIWAHRQFLTDEGCFATQTCDALRTLTEARFESPLQKIWLDIHGDYRWVRMTGDGGPITAMVARSWTDKVFLADGSGAWNQYFHLDAFVEDPTDASRSLRWQVGWMERHMNVGDDLMRSLYISGMEQSFVFQDEFVQGTVTSCERDISLEKPDRY